MAHARVLLAESNYAECRRMEDILESYAIDVDTVSNGLGILGLVRKHTYDLALLSVTMPIMSGVEAACFLKADKRFYALPLIALLSSDQDESQLSGIDFAKCLREPIEAEQLRNEVKKYAPNKMILEERQVSHYLDPVQAPETIESSLGSKDNFSDQTDPYAFLVDFDVKQGLGRVLNNENLYCRLLKEFQRSLEEFLSEFRNRSTTIKELLPLIHSIKGTSGNMGAVHLHTETVAFEKELKTKPDMPESRWHPKFEKFLSLVEKTKQEINAFSLAESKQHSVEIVETSTSADKTLDLASQVELEELLHKTIQQVQEYTPSASDTFARVQKLLGSRYRSEQKNIQVCLEAFDFEKAEEELSRLIELIKVASVNYPQVNRGA